ncbi:MAG: twin-arginine translocase TatA/TatE family subunit [Microthrixaceae bacterium]|nr:twin-arginine translocase TatA/TatE family subunit [Microthrixaceae bacterium]
MNLGGNEVLIVVILALVIFGGSQLPKIARNLGSAQKEFKKGLAESKAEGKDEEESKSEAASSDS